MKRKKAMFVLANVIFYFSWQFAVKKKIMKLDLTSLQNAVQSLEKALNEYKVNPNEFVRDSCIQRFEYTYELCWKMLKRHLEINAPTPNEIDSMPFQELIRKGNENALLLNDWEAWKKYRLYRGATSHTYDQDKANEILKEIPAFLDESKFLLKQLQLRNF
jgi:nucleotidyltransferase substrate binding protein (TIGR01987 family)